MSSNTVKLAEMIQEEAKKPGIGAIAIPETISEPSPEPATPVQIEVVDRSISAIQSLLQTVEKTSTPALLVSSSALFALTLATHFLLPIIETIMAIGFGSGAAVAAGIGGYRLWQQSQNRAGQ